jgi:GTPase SAR1 family protein
MKTYYKGASAALIVYDVTREESFLNLDNEHKLISSSPFILEDFIKGDIITMIVGNKIDLEEKRVVSKQRGLEYAESKKIAFYEVSAKEGTNINLIFTRIAEGTCILIQN